MNLLGKRIIDSREALNMKQKELAELIGVTKATMCKYENGQNIPNADILCALARALHTSSDYLLGLSDIREPYGQNWFYIEPSEQEMIRLVLSLSHDDKLRISERATILHEKKQI